MAGLILVLMRSVKAPVTAGASAQVVEGRRSSLLGTAFDLVNGEQVLSGGRHTGAKPVRFVEAPGYLP